MEQCALWCRGRKNTMKGASHSHQQRNLARPAAPRPMWRRRRPWRPGCSRAPGRASVCLSGQEAGANAAIVPLVWLSPQENWPIDLARARSIDARSSAEAAGAGSPSLAGTRRHPKPELRRARDWNWRGVDPRRLLQVCAPATPPREIAPPPAPTRPLLINRFRSVFRQRSVASCSSSWTGSACVTPARCPARRR